MFQPHSSNLRSNEQRGLNRLIAFILAALSLYFVIRFATPQLRGAGVLPTDFSVFYRAAERFQQGLPVYVALDSSPFKYSPVFLITVSQFLKLFAPATSWFLWCTANILVWCGALYVFVSQLPLTRAQVPLFILALLTSWHGHLEHLSYGQADYIVCGLMLFAYTTTKPKLSGALIAISLLIKPAALLLLAGFIFTGAWMPLLSAAVIGTGLYLTTGLYLYVTNYGATIFTLTEQWLTSLNAQPSELFSGNLNQALGAVIARVLNHPEWSEPLCKTIFMLGLLVLAGGFFVGFKAKINKNNLSSPATQATLISLSFALFLLCNPLSWRWNTFLWLPMALLAYTQKGITKLSALFLIGFTLTAALLHKIIATPLGITEIDVLSYYGLYGWASLFLTLALATVAAPTTSKAVTATQRNV